VTPAARREAAEYVEKTYSVGKRRSCGLMSLERSTYYYRPRPANDGPLRERLRALTQKYRRWGIDTLTHKLRQDGWADNHKRIYRVYREEKLQLQRRRRRKRAYARGSPLPQASAPDTIWALDFVSDQLASGRRIRALVVLDIYSRECLAIVVATSISGERVARELDRLIEVRGVAPQQIITDNGPEFQGKAMLRWTAKTGVNHHFIEPGKPRQNGYVEGFNSTLREYCLNEHWFAGMEEATNLIEAWRKEYNTEKPHTSLNGETPANFAARGGGQARPPAGTGHTQPPKPTEALSF
jgi:putative transposase